MNVLYYRMVNSAYGLQYYPCSAPQQLPSTQTGPAMAVAAPGAGTLTQATGLPGQPALGAPAPTAPGLGAAGLTGPGIMPPAAKWVFPNFSSTQIQYMFRPRLDKPRQNKAVKCETCNITLNSEQQAQQHYSGKNHLKKVRQLSGKDSADEERTDGDDSHSDRKRSSPDSKSSEEGAKRRRTDSSSSATSIDKTSIVEAGDKCDIEGLEQSGSCKAASDAASVKDYGAFSETETDTLIGDGESLAPSDSASDADECHATRVKEVSADVVTGSEDSCRDVPSSGADQPDASTSMEVMSQSTYSQQSVAEQQPASVDDVELSASVSTPEDELDTTISDKQSLCEGEFDGQCMAEGADLPQLSPDDTQDKQNSTPTLSLSADSHVSKRLHSLSQTPCDPKQDLSAGFRQDESASLSPRASYSSPQTSSASIISSLPLTTKGTPSPPYTNERRGNHGHQFVNISSQSYRTAAASRLQQPKSLLGSPGAPRYTAMACQGLGASGYMLQGAPSNSLSAGNPGVYSPYAQQLTSDPLQQTNSHQLSYPSTSSLTRSPYGIPLQYASNEVHQSLSLGSLYSPSSLPNNLTGLDTLSFSTPSNALMADDNMTSSSIRPGDIGGYLGSGMTDASGIALQHQRLKYNMESNLVLDGQSLAYQPFGAVYQSVSLGLGDAESQMLAQNNLLLQSGAGTAMLDHTASAHLTPTAALTSPAIGDNGPKSISQEEWSKMDPISQAVYDNIMGNLPVRRKRDLHCKQCDLSMSSEAQMREHFRTVRHSRRSRDTGSSIERTPSGNSVRW